MPRRTALFGGSFNPPGLHHRRIAERLAQNFDEVRLVPCGPRPDKPEVGLVPSVFRAALCDITFGGLDRVFVDLFDLEGETFTRSHALETRYAAVGDEVWHVVGADWLTGGAEGCSAIHTGWERGTELWQGSRFAVLTRPGHPLDPRDLPPQHELIEIELDESSTGIRDLLLHAQDAAPLLTPRAQRYIDRYGLYRGTNPASWSPGTLAGLKCQLHSSTRHPDAPGWAARFRPHIDERAPDYITVLGGDGAMLRGIRDHWRRRLPFFGINAGHVGFLMNAPDQVFATDVPGREVIFRQLPLIYVEIETTEGQTVSAHAFNDAWVERATSQSAWLQLTVNGVPRIEKLVSDGALLATAAGSTAYARAMGAAPLLADTPAWLLVGSNVMEPAHWKSALLSTDTKVEITCLDPERRPVTAYVDGVALGQVRSLRARLSRAATAELVFLANRDMAEKIAGVQFMR